MKFRLPVLAVMLVAVLAVTSCSASQNIIINVNVTCEEFQYKSSNMANDFEVNVGDQIKAKLCVNATSGYNWDYAIDNTNVVEFANHDYIAPGVTSNLTEMPGVDIWGFKAIKPGDAVVSMAYTKPTDNGTDTKYTYTLNVTVLDNKK